MSAPISVAQALAHVCPDYLDGLKDVDALVAAFDLDLWMRPEQRVPRGPLRSFGIIGGRGYGKTAALAYELNRRVEAGEARSIGLMAPTEDRVSEVQVAALVELSPPWFKCEAYGKGARWPNGVVAECHTSVAPDGPRSSNFDTSWLCEIVSWQRTTRLEAFYNMTTATRVGRAQYFWDTTSKGKNEVIQLLQRQATNDPESHVLIRGTTFDNPLLSRAYLRDEIAKYTRGSQRYLEEIEGQVFAESAGALWKQAWIDDHRVNVPPPNPDATIVSLDPSLSDGPNADEAGCAALARDRRGHVFVLEDFSGRQKPEKWAKTAVDWCERGAAGILYERNHAGDMPRDLITLVARDRKLSVEVLPNDDKRPFPPRKPGTIYVKSITTRNDKGTRAEAPAAMYQRGQVHHVGTFAQLELEMTAWEPGEKSPNRLDAVAQGVAELAGLRDTERRPDVGRDASGADRLQSGLRELTTGIGGLHGLRRLGL